MAMEQVGKWKILRVCDDRDKDGHLLFFSYCTRCGFIKRGARIFNLQKSAYNECTHAVVRNWPSKRLSSVYTKMIHRCHNPKAQDYRFYGGKGIKVCDKWLEDPQNFISWAVATGYEEDLTIDRIDPTKNYCPENCRWVDSLTNSKFKSTTRVLVIDAIKDSLTGHAKRYNIAKTTLFSNVRNKTDDEAIEYIKSHSGIV